MSETIKFKKEIELLNEMIKENIEYIDTNKCEDIYNYFVVLGYHRYAYVLHAWSICKTMKHVVGSTDEDIDNFCKVVNKKLTSGEEVYACYKTDYDDDTHTLAIAFTNI